MLQLFLNIFFVLIFSIINVTQAACPSPPGTPLWNIINQEKAPPGTRLWDIAVQIQCNTIVIASCLDQVKSSTCFLQSQIEVLDSEVEELASGLDTLITFKEFQNHQGKKERFAGNNGTGQSAQIFFDVDPLAPVTGTRDTDTVFTRDSGMFESPIITGTAVAGGANTITLDAGASGINDFYTTNIISITAGTGIGQIRTISDYVGGTKVATVSVAWLVVPDATSEFEIVSGLYVGQYAFSFESTAAGLKTWPPVDMGSNNLTDGIWLPIVQNTSTSIVVDGILHIPGTGLVTSVFNPAANLYAHDQGSLAFSGGVFDGKYLWLAPYLSPDIVRVNPATGQMTSIPHNKNVIRAFCGAVYDGESVWLVPYSSRDIIKIAADGTLTSIPHGKGVSFAFWGGTFDGTNIWFAPQNSPDILKIDPATGTMTSIAHGKGTFAFLGAAFDGFNVWLAPFDSDDIVKIDPTTNALTSIAHGKGAQAFSGAVFDGRYIWMIPFSSPDIIRIDPTTDTFESFPHGQGTFAFVGGAFDGESIWMAPQFSENILDLFRN
jgi:streptogramin lyase